MEKIEYEKMYVLEQSHWWFRGKKKIVISAFKRFVKKRPNLKILDIGCGTGAMLKSLNNYGSAYGVDYSPEAVSFCKKRGLKQVKVGSIMKLPFSDDYFDAITCLDVLYHKGITDDQLALKELYRVCKKEGIIIITDSACKALWGRHDLAVHARERYSKRELQYKVKKAGFLIMKISYYNFLLFPIVFVTRKIDSLLNQNKQPQSNVKETKEIINTILFRVLSLESFLLRFLNFPIGVSLLCVAKKE